eukprot:XP_020404606.1 36.4 kDa proline-rich protein-like [Zea mays]
MVRRLTRWVPKAVTGREATPVRWASEWRVHAAVTDAESRAGMAGSSAEPRRRRRSSPPQPAAPPRLRPPTARPPAPTPTPRSPRPRPRREVVATAAATTPYVVPSSCPHRVPAVLALAVPSSCPAASPCLPSSCPRRALAVPSPPHPATRQLVRDPSIRPRPVVPPVGYD